MFSIFPWHYPQMKASASSLGILMIFFSMFFLWSPTICIFYWSSLTVMMNCSLLNFLILTISRLVLSELLFLMVLSVQLSVLERTLFLRQCEDLRVKGQKAMFFIIYFCFFHYYLSLCESQSDFLSCNRLRSLAFSTQMVSSCFFFKDACRLRCILGFYSSRSDFLFMVVVIFYSRYLFSLSISVNLSSWSLSFFCWLRTWGSHSGSQLVGLACLSLSKWLSLFLSISHLVMVFFPLHSDAFIILFDYISLSNHSHCFTFYLMQSRYLPATVVQLSAEDIAFSTCCFIFGWMLCRLRKQTSRAMFLMRSGLFSEPAMYCCSSGYAFAGEAICLVSSSMKREGWANWSVCLLILLLRTQSLSATSRMMQPATRRQ